MKFKYTAKEQTGLTTKGTVEASNQKAAIETLQQKGLVIVQMKEIRPASGFSLSAMFGHVSANDVVNFTRQLSTMITAGLPITDALNLLKIQSGQAMSLVIGSLMDDVQAGMPLSGAMSRFPNVFSRVYVALVKAGESAGVLEKVLNRLADNTEKSREFRGKVGGALIYPIIIVIGMVIVTILMMTMVIPQLTAVYQDFNAELPWPTIVVIGISNFSVHYWWLGLIVTGLVIYAWISYIRTEIGRKHFDSFMYQIPIVGALSKEIMITELTRTLALLISAGISIVEALNIVSEALGNVNVEEDVRRISKQVEKGFPISISFLESQIFPPIVGQMVAVGEETGKLDEVLNKLSHYFEVESDEKVKGLTVAIEPIILVILAVGVGFLMFAVIMPIYSITNKI